MQALTIMRAALVALALCLVGSASAEELKAFVVPTCGSVTLPTGDPRTPYMGPDGRLCVDTGAGASGQKVDTVVQGTAVYRGGTVTAGGTSQQLLATNATRRGFTVQNQSTGDLYIKVGAAATVSNVSLRIAPGALYETQPQHASTGVVNIIGATTGQAFYATEY